MFEGGPWRLLLANLDAGEPVEIYAWFLPDSGRSIGVKPGARVVLEVDGAVRLV